MVVTGQPSEELAKSVALDTCQKRVEAAKVTAKCEIYAVGHKVVSVRSHPPMPPAPYITHDPLVERPFNADEMPLLREPAKENLRRNYVNARKPKAVAIGPLVGADLNMFVWRNPEGAVGNIELADKRVNTYIFAGVQGRFDLGGARDAKLEQVTARR